MTRRHPLRLLLQNTVSRGVLGFAAYPVLFKLGISPAYKASCEFTPLQEKTSLSFLAWVQMWLRLALGLDICAAPQRTDFNRFDAPRIRHSQVNLAEVKGPPTHTLEALMIFAPDAAGQGLTLNQYRERFTRISVLGRFRIYSGALLRKYSRRRCIRYCLRLRRSMTFGCPAFCAAPLHPD